MLPSNFINTLKPINPENGIRGKIRYGFEYRSRGRKVRSFFIRPNLQLDNSLKFEKEQNRIYCYTNVTNKRAEKRRQFSGRNEACDCQPELTLIDSNGNKRTYSLIWLVYSDASLERNPTQVKIQVGKTTPVYLFVLDITTNEIIIPMISSAVGIWNGNRLPHGEYEIKLQITRSGVVIGRECEQKYGKFKPLLSKPTFYVIVGPIQQYWNV